MCITGGGADGTKTKIGGDAAVNDTASLQSEFSRWQKTSLLIGLAALVLCALGAGLNPKRFFEAYLMAYVFWLGIALGCQAILMIHHLAGGRWGFAIRRLLEAASKTLPLLTVLFIPILFGLHNLYIWTHPDIVAADEVLRHKQPYLNVPFFVVRAGVYFAAWLGTMVLLNRAGLAQDQTPSREATRRLTLISGAGLALYMLTMTFASIDWMMSLEPTWFSTIYGLLIMTGQVLGAFAFVIIVAAVLVRYKPYAGIILPLYFHDLGNFLLTFVIFWAYMAFSQFLIIWSGNLPDENSWYLHRFAGNWKCVGVMLIVLYFFLPFLLLLSRDVTNRSSWLSKVALTIFVMGLVDVFWIVAPGFGRPAFRVYWMDIAAPIGIGGVWVAMFIKQLKGQSTVPAHDSRIEEEFEWA
jgi:hypothetical protein